MKGLNIKKIAALGIGAALVGSALAPMVSAANMVSGGLDSLERDHIVDSTGSPVVDVVVGSGAAVSDVVWAGNIAAKVAQLATVSAGEAGETAVDITIGGTQSVSGSGESVKEVLSAGQEFDVSVTSTSMPALVNNTSYKYRWGSTTQQTSSLQETLDGNMDVSAQMQTGSTRYAVGELIASVSKNALEYNVTLGTGLDLDSVAGSTGLDSNSAYDLTLPIFGKDYVLDEVKTDGTLVFYADTTPTDLLVGEEVAITDPASAYADSDMSVKLVDLVQTGSGTGDNSYEAKWALMKDGSVVKYIQKAPGSSAYNLKDEFGSSYFNDNIYVTAAGLNLASQTYTATIRTGSDRLELKNGKGFPYTGDSTVDSDAQWEVAFSTANFTGITISNQWTYTKTSGNETDTSKYVLKVGEGISLPNDYAVFNFNGFEDKASTAVTLGNGALNYVDLKGTQISVPFYNQFDVEANEVTVVTVGNQDYSFWFTDANVTYVKGDYSSAESQASLIAVSGSETLITDFASGDANTVQIDLGERPYTGSTPTTVDYRVDVNLNNGIGFLLLSTDTFYIYSKNHTDSTITFVGTADINSEYDDYTYFRPNMSEYLTDVLGVTSSDHNYYAAKFTLSNNGAADVNLYVRADETGDVWNYDALADLDSSYYKFGPVLDAESSEWGTSAIRDGSDYLLAAATVYGTSVVSDNSVFDISVPEEQRNVQAYLGSTDATTVTVGGETLTDIAVGGSKTSTAGTTITVDKVAGATGGVTVVATPANLVKTDASTYGKSIIVGGWLVNAAAEALEVSEGQTLEDLITASGDYVAAVLNSGDIVVAGYTGVDTGKAASELINALEDLI